MKVSSTSCLKKKTIEQYKRDERTRHEAETHRRAKLSELERKTETACKHIQEVILTLKCPRPDCRQAFADFDGCFALTCSRCRCAFCAWCLKDCGQDAHACAAACGAKRGANGYYGDVEGFNAAQKEQRLKRVCAYLRGLDDVVRQRVIDGCRKGFEDLQLNEVFKEFGADRVEREAFQADVGGAVRGPRGHALPRGANRLPQRVPQGIHPRVRDIVQQPRRHLPRPPVQPRRREPYQELDEQMALQLQFGNEDVDF